MLIRDCCLERRKACSPTEYLQDKQANFRQVFILLEKLCKEMFDAGQAISDNKKQSALEWG